MKKILALMLAFIMLLSFAACSSSSTSTEDDTDEEATTEEEVVDEEAADEEDAAEEDTVTDEEAADEESADETDWSAIAAEIDSVTIVFNATVNETEVSGQIISQFGTYLEELSDGKITLNVYWGGTVYDDATQFQAIRDGAVDMISINPMQDSSYLPYLSCMSVYGTGSAENVLNLFKALEFENEETAEIIQAEAAEYNLKYLNVLANGVDALYSTFEWDTLEEFMSGSSCVGSGDTGIFKLMGMNVSDVTPSEVYDALQRGICDSTNCALSAAYSMSWDEVASNIVIDGLWAAGNNFTINIDFWNTLSEGQQQIIQEAADRASDYSLELQNEMESTMIEEMESRSDMTIKYLSDEDSLEYYGYLFTSSVENSLNQVSGDEDATAKIVTILEFVSDYLGYDWEYEG